MKQSVNKKLFKQSNKPFPSLVESKESLNTLDLTKLRRLLRKKMNIRISPNKKLNNKAKPLSKYQVSYIFSLLKILMKVCCQISPQWARILNHKIFKN